MLQEHRRPYAVRIAVGSSLLFALGACSSGGAGVGFPSSVGGGMGTGTGGATAVGGNPTAGPGSSGGSPAGGAVSAGGVNALGGAMSNGGGTSNGGAPNGGITSTGGSRTVGGATAAGGTTALGGITGNGGTASGGTFAGGAATGGAATGGVGRGGAATGGTGTGGAATGGVAMGGTGAGTGGATHTGKWLVMPVGDSITATTCYPQLLSKNLISTGHTNFQFVGGVLNNQSCSATNVQTEGHGGWLVTSLLPGGANASVVAGWFTAARPEIVLLHFATNDVWSSIAPATILNAYSVVVDAARAAVPNVIIFAAQIIPLAPAGCTDCPTRVATLNQQVPGWASGKTTSTSPIYVVDVATGFVPTTDTGDGVHPNVAGSQKMADSISPVIIAKNLF